MTRTTVGVIVGNHAPLFEVSVAPRVFEISPEHFEVMVAAEYGSGPVQTTQGISISTPYRLDALWNADIVIVPGWRPPGGAPVHPDVLQLLRDAHARGALVVGLCLGTFVLAEAGLLDFRRVTTHWRYLTELATTYPLADVVDYALYIDAGPIVTSAGSAAGLDACLHVLRRRCGPEVANTAARALVVAPQRPGGQTQFVDRPVPRLPAGDAVADAMRHALERLADPDLDIDRLAATAHLSRRTFDRRFRELSGSSPLKWLLHQRILHAQDLLASTDLTIDAVARASGFSNGVSMRPQFRRHLGVSPQSYRSSFRAV